MVWLFNSSKVHMYFNENLVKFTYCLQLIDICLKIGVCINNKMLIWLIHAGYEGINHCTQKISNT